MRNYRFFHTFEKNILVTVKNWCSLTYGQVYIYSNGDLDFWPNDPNINRVLPLPQGIMWPSLVKIQYTELKLSCGNDPVVKNYIYSNGDLDFWPNDPTINRFLSLPKWNHVAKFGKYPIYRTKVIVRKPAWTPARLSAYKNGKDNSNHDR